MDARWPSFASTPASTSAATSSSSTARTTPRTPSRWPPTPRSRDLRRHPPPPTPCRPSPGPPRAGASIRATRSRTDRKSTRLNSSHEWISYAVFCLKKKKTVDPYTTTLTANHYAVTPDVILLRPAPAYLDRDTEEQSSQADAEHFLPEQYVQVTSPS